MEEIDHEIMIHEQSLAATFKSKFKLMEDALKAKEEGLQKVVKQYEELKTQFDYNLRVIDERDQDIRDIQKHFEETIEISKQKNILMEQSEKEWSIKFEKLQKEMQSKTYEIRDYQEKLKDAKREINFYKKGYLDEIESYKKVIAQKDIDIEDYKKELVRIRKDELGAVEKRYEEAISQTKETYNKLLDQLKEDSNQQKMSDRQLIEAKQEQIIKLQTDIDKINIEREGEYREREKSMRREMDRLEKYIEECNRDIRIHREKEIEYIKSMSTLESKYNDVHNSHRMCDDRYSKMKAKYKGIIRDINGTYESKIVDIVHEYRQDVESKQREIDNITGMYNRCMSDMKVMNQKIVDNERYISNNNNDIDSIIQDRYKQYIDDIQQLNNKIEILEYKDKDSMDRFNALNNKYHMIQQQIVRDKVKYSDIEKDNHILIQQIVSMKDRDNDRLDVVDSMMQESGKDSILRDNEQYKHMINMMKDEMVNTKKEIEGILHDNEQYKSKYNDVLDKYNKCNDEMMTLRERNMEMSEKIRDMSSMIDRYKGLQRMYDDMNSKYTDIVSQYNRSIDDNNSKIHALTMDRDTLIHTINRYKHKINGMQHSTQHNNSIDVYISQIDQLHIDIDRLNSIIQERDNTIQRMMKDIDSSNNNTRDNSRKKKESTVDRRKVRNYNMKDDT